MLRRRTWSYLFITVAIGMLVFRSVVGFLSLGGPIEVQTHHVLEHLFDVVAILLLFAAILAGRTAPTKQTNEYQDPPEGR